MDIGEELDKLAAEGRVSSVSLIQLGGGWQVYLKMGLVNDYIAKRGASPSAVLAAAIADLPQNEAYELRFGTAAVAARAQAEAEPKGIFD
ncbi:hypothetical protein [Bradyrhizobium liaoningense]|uniref:hypothetical protein n=1 Tax=Bradyrhizobium liaoningense TaxID=43992 RepID=UPI0004B26501|nr:hypothetical protein [Bradyrhizobium liaoningense]